MTERAIQVYCNDRTKQFGILLKPTADCPWRELLCLPCMSRDEYVEAKARGAEFRTWLVDNLTSHYYDEILMQGAVQDLDRKPLGLRLRARWHKLGNEAIIDLGASANMEMIL